MRIDWWTLALQTINVLVLVWLLARFLFRPVMGMVAERRAAAEKLLADAATVRAEAETQANAIRQRLAGVSAEGERMLTEARATAETERTRLLQQAADAAAHTRDAAQAALANDRATMERALRQKACDLAIAIARRLLRLLPARAATAALLEAVGAAVTDLPEEQRRDLAASAGPIDVVTAVPLDAGQQAECRDLLGRLFGRAPVLVFRTDPALIAGVELHTAQMLIRNSWQADLQRIADELGQEEENVAGSERLA